MAPESISTNSKEEKGINHGMTVPVRQVGKTTVCIGFDTMTFQITTEILEWIPIDEEGISYEIL